MLHLGRGSRRRESCLNGTPEPFPRTDRFRRLSLNMVSLFILGFAVFALAKLGIAQWRAIWISTANRTLSQSFQATAGIDGEKIEARDFTSILQLGERICPGLRKASPWLAEVSVYYRVVQCLDKTLRGRLAPISEWASREMQLCSRYVAVVIDQSLSMDLDRQIAARTS